MNETVFISIAAYNEPDLLQTVKSCIENAAYPDRLSFGIFSLNSDNQSVSIPHKNVKLITAQHESLLGVGFSRINSVGLYNGEDYFFQIDAHMLFEKDWDIRIIEKYKLIKENYSKPIITTYVPWWYKDQNNQPAFEIPFGTASASPMKYTGEIHKGSPSFMTYGVDWGQALYFEHHGLSAHFIFTQGKFATEILPDPLITFLGEEPTTAMRAWTRGYRMFAIEDGIAWHLNKPAGKIYEKDRLATYNTESGRIFYEYKTNNSLKRVKDILLGRILGYWGSPSIDLLTNYQIAANISFEKLYKEYGDQDV